jgi:hypothetical protein
MAEGQWITTKGGDRLFIGGDKTSAHVSAARSQALSAARSTTKTKPAKSTAGKPTLIDKPPEGFLEGTRPHSRNYEHPVTKQSLELQKADQSRYNAMSKSKEEADALWGYRQDGYKQINGDLRADPTVKPGTPAAHLQNLCSRAEPTAQDSIVYRHTAAYNTSFPAVGESTYVKGFTSSANVSQERFVRSNGYTFEIRVPKGSTGVLSGFNIAEREVMLRHGAKLKYLGSMQMSYSKGKPISRPGPEKSLDNLTHFFEYQG